VPTWTAQGRQWHALLFTLREHSCSAIGTSPISNRFYYRLSLILPQAHKRCIGTGDQRPTHHLAIVGNTEPKLVPTWLHADSQVGLPRQGQVVETPARSVTAIFSDLWLSTSLSELAYCQKYRNRFSFNAHDGLRKTRRFATIGCRTR
jgi:hypothetical protein